jgi:hypothetical protein
LNAVIAAIRDYDGALPECDTAAAAELPRTTAFAAHIAHMGAVTHAQHLNTAVDTVMHEHVAAAVDRNAAGIVELPISTTSFTADGSNVTAIGIP